VSVPEESAAAARAALEAAGVPFADLGETVGDDLRIEGALALPLRELEAAWEGTIPAAMTR